jgi:CubicO group peptidase (beta-lactamase class C family)
MTRLVASALRTLGPAFTLVVAVGGIARAQGTSPPWPDIAWPRATAAEMPAGAAILDSLDQEIVAGRYGFVDRMLVIQGGRVLMDRTYRHDYRSIYGDSARVRGALNANDPTGPYNYFNAWWHPYYRGGPLHSLQSVTKTVTSVVIGVARARGDFPSLDTPIIQYFDTSNVQHLDERKRRITIWHLLTMSGGFEWDEGMPYVDPRNSAVAMESSMDWIKYVLDRPMAVEPGSRYRYSSGESQLLAQVFQRATGEDIEAYAAAHLFAPLGIRAWHWKRTPTGLVDTEGGLYLEAGDLARIWYLFLRGGRWRDAQVVSESWVRESTTPAFAVGPAAAAPRYGYKWFLHRDPGDSTRTVWAGSGFGGQFPLAFPRLDLVVVFNGWNLLPGRPSLPLLQVIRRLSRLGVEESGR